MQTDITDFLGLSTEKNKGTTCDVCTQKRERPFFFEKQNTNLFFFFTHTFLSVAFWIYKNP